MITTLCIDSDKQAKKDGQRLKKINLTENEWSAIENLIPILAPFAEATELLGGSKYATISFMYHAINVITKGVASFEEEEVEVVDFTKPNMAFDDNIGYEDADDEDVIDNQPSVRKIKINIPQDCENLISKVKHTLHKSLTHYWNVPEDYGLIAALLDPRCKSLTFISSTLRNNIHSKLRLIYDELRLENGEQEMESHEEHSVNSLLTSMFNQRHEHSDEIIKYLAIEEIGFSECPFNWWHQNENRFPILSKIARKYLAIPATSTPSERLFSNAGNIMTIRRTNLLPSTFEHLLFLKRNWNLVGSIFPEK